MFTSFHEPANEGLRFIYSKDGYHWNDIDKVFLKPAIGNQKVLRDPSIAQGKDGIYRLVWTSSWKGDLGFGYAASKDLIHWGPQSFIPVLNGEPTTVNVWAPELFFDADSNRFIIVWASCIPNRFERGIEDVENNHRLYYTTTKDFVQFTPTKLFLDPKFSVIDATIVKRAKNDYVVVLKDNTRPNRNIKIAFGKTPIGPFENISNPITDSFSEGPSVVEVKNEWLIYFDAYKKQTYEAIRTKDFKNFELIDSLIQVPQGHKHGTIFRAKNKLLKGLLAQLPFTATTLTNTQ